MAETLQTNVAKTDAQLFGVASVGRHAMLYAIGNILSKAVAFLMLPIYTRYLSPADYGVAALVDMSLNVIAIVAGEKIAQGIFRFYHKADSDAERRAVVSTALTSLAISFGLLGLAIFATAGWLSSLLFDSPVHAGIIQLAAGSFILHSVVFVPLAFCRVQERSGLVLGANIVRLVSAVSLNILFIVGMDMGVRGVFLSTLVSNLVLALWLGTWTIKRVGLGIRPEMLRSLIRYGVPLMGVQAATFTMTFSDRYFLKAAGDVAAVGIYNLAYQFGFLLLMLGFVPIEMVWGPRRFQVARTANPSPLLARAFRLINVSVISLAVAIALFAGDLLRIMATPPFHPAADVVPIILIAYVFSGWATLHDIGALVKERTEFLTVANWVAAGVALLSFSLLIPRYHARGAAISAVLAFGVRWALTYHFSQRLWKVEYVWRPVVLLAAAGITTCVVSGLLPRLPLPFSIATHVLLLALYSALIWSLPILTAEEKRAGRGHLRRVVRLRPA